MPTAYIVVVTNQKGGSGKTTVTMNLAGTFGLQGNKVLVVDADPQGTATRWAASATDDEPFPATVCGLAAAGGKVHREVRKFVDSYDYIFVDCPPAVDSPIPQSALLIANLALVPIVPSPPDIWAGVGIRDLISNLSDINEGLEARLVANMLQPNTTLGRDAIALLDDFGIPLAATRLHQRTVYRQTAAYGSTVQAMGSRAAPAIDEINRLLNELTIIRTNGVSNADEAKAHDGRLAS